MTDKYMEIFKSYLNYSLTIEEYDEEGTKIIRSVKENDLFLFANLIIKYPNLFWNIVSFHVNYAIEEEDLLKIFYELFLKFCFNLSNTTPYSVSSVYSAYVAKGSNFKTRLTEAEGKKIIKNILNKPSIELTIGEKRFVHLIKDEEQIRIFWKNEYTKIKEWYDNINDENIQNILESLKDQGLTDEKTFYYIEKVLEEKKEYDKIDDSYVESYEKPKKVKKDFDCKGLDLSLKKRPMATSKDIKQIQRELQEIFDKVFKEKQELSVDNYLLYLQKSLLLESDEDKKAPELAKSLRQDLSTLFLALQMNEDTFNYLKEKGIFTSDLDIETKEVMIEISNIEGELNDASIEEKEIYYELLKEQYSKLKILLSKNYKYERTLKFN